MAEHVTRVRREARPEASVGKFLEEAAVEAGNRIVRRIEGPPPTDAEKEILAGSAHEQARLYSHVLVTDLETGEQERFHIVRDGEGDPMTGALSIASPIGRALLMEYPGAIVAAKTPAGKRLYRILRVED